MTTITRNNRPVWIAATLLIGALISGCSGTPTSDDDSGNFEQALAYAKCMRENGMPNFADPQRDANGGFQLKKEMHKGEEAAMKKAEEACRDKDPANNADDDGGTVDSAKLAAWTKCMRGKFPKFPDPEVAGGTITIDLRGTGIEGGEGSDYEKAREECGDAGGNTRSMSGDLPDPAESGK